MSDFDKISGLLAPVLELLARLTGDIISNQRLSEDEKRQLLKNVAAQLNSTAQKVAAREI